MNITQDMKDVCFQPSRKIHIKIELLNFQFKVVDELSGIAIDIPSTTEDAESDIRRTCNVSMVVKDSTLELQPGGKIWLDKYINLYQGIENIHNSPEAVKRYSEWIMPSSEEQGYRLGEKVRHNNRGWISLFDDNTLEPGVRGWNEVEEIIWVPMGIYMINQPSYSYEPSSKTLSFEGVDLMAKLTGLRNGQLEGIEYQIPAGNSIKQVIIDTIKMAGFNKYIIDIRPNEDVLPYDVNIDAGSTIYDILAALRDVYITYQFYFDVDGIFHFEPIPTGENILPALTYSEIKKLELSHTVDADFENVKNYIEVFGQTYEVDAFATNVAVTYESGLAVYDCNIDTPVELTDLFWFGFYAPSKVSDPWIRINDSELYEIISEDGEQVIIPTDNDYYVLQFDLELNKFIFLGYLQIRAIAKDNNRQSPFFIGDHLNPGIGQIRMVCLGGDYENIPTNKLAQNRADFELWHHCRLQDTITINMVPVPYLNVYDLIEYKLPQEENPVKYLIKNINTGLSYDGTQTITAYRYYSYSPEGE